MLFFARLATWALADCLTVCVVYPGVCPWPRAVSWYDVFVHVCVFVGQPTGSYLMPVSEIQRKLASYAHSEYASAT
jgi:hypothetical protein